MRYKYKLDVYFTFYDHRRPTGILPVPVVIIGKLSICLARHLTHLNCFIGWATHEHWIVNLEDVGPNNHNADRCSVFSFKEAVLDKKYINQRLLAYFYFIPTPTSSYFPFQSVWRTWLTLRSLEQTPGVTGQCHSMATCGAPIWKTKARFISQVRNYRGGYPQKPFTLYVTLSKVDMLHIVLKFPRNIYNNIFLCFFFLQV